MKTKYLSLIGAVLLIATGGSLSAQTLILGDDYNVAGSGTGFALGSGVNSGINPPTTRLTGPAAPDLRYYKYSGTKPDANHSITTEKFTVTRADNPSVMTLGPGTGAFDFSQLLRAVAASPSLPSVYEVRFKMSNPTSPGIQRASFGITSDAGGVAVWDFGIQFHRETNNAPRQQISRRIDELSHFGATDLNTIITNMPDGTYGLEYSFLMRITDAGMETPTMGTASSRVQLSMDDGLTWLYDTQTDPELVSGAWRLDTVGRYFFWDVSSFGRLTFDDFTVTWISGPEASTVRTWTGQGADANWSTPANWDTGVPAVGDKLIFAGTSRQVNNNNIDGLIVPWITISNGGFELAGNGLTISSGVTNISGLNAISAPNSWATTSAKTWAVTPGSELRLDGPTTVDVNGNLNLQGGGNLRVKNSFAIGSQSTANPAVVINEGQFALDGAIANFSSIGGFRIASQASAVTNAEVVLTNSATFALTTAGGNFRVGDSATPFTSRLLINNSTLNMAGGSLGIPYAAGATGEVIQVGGSVAGAVVAFSDSGAGQGKYSIKNGVLEPRQIRKDTAAGFGSIHFDNAILRTALGAQSEFMSGVDQAEVLPGGLTIEATQLDVALDQAFSGPGSITKGGSYSAALVGTNELAGNMAVTAGRLVLSTVHSNTGAIQVSGGTELGVMVKAPGTSLKAGSLNFASGAPSALSIDLSTFSNPTAPLLEVGSLSAATTVTINVTNGSPAMTPGLVTLIKYGGSIGGGFASFVKGTLPAGMQGQLVNNPGSLDLMITAVQGFRWTAAVNSDWDTTTVNWVSTASGTPSAYSDGFQVEFRDGAASGLVNNYLTVTPSAIVVSNQALSYNFNGGTISTPLLKKQGLGTFTRTDGTYDAIQEFEINEGFFVISNNYDADFAAVISDATDGLGTISKAGPSTLGFYSTNDTFDGDIVVKEGVLKLGNDNSLGSTNGSTIISNGATLNLNDMIVPQEPVIVSGAGFNGMGAITESPGTNNVKHNLTDVTLLGDTTFACDTGGRWDIRVRSGSGVGPGLRANGYNLTKIGAGTVSIACQRHDYGTGVPVPYWHMNLGNVLISEGGLTFAESLTLDNPDKTITISPGASMNMFDLGWSNPIVRRIIMSGVTISSGGGTRDTNVLAGPIELTGANYMAANSETCLILDGSLSGAGSLTFAGGGRGMLVMNGVNTFTGDTTITNGTLSGNGTLAGNLVMVAGTNSPGFGVGTFTVNGNATLAGSTLMQLAPGQAVTSDRLNVGGTLTLGGDLRVVFAPGAGDLSGGEVFQLFNKGGNGDFASISLPALPAGLSWNTSDLKTTGALKVAGSIVQPIFSGAALVDGNLVISGSGGVEGSTYYVLTSTNVAAPANEWLRSYTNVFGPGGTFSITNAVPPAGPPAFFRMELP